MATRKQELAKVVTAVRGAIPKVTLGAKSDKGRATTIPVNVADKVKAADGKDARLVRAFAALDKATASDDFEAKHRAADNLTKLLNLKAGSRNLVADDKDVGLPRKPRLDISHRGERVTPKTPRIPR
jgi:hypothetical protein